MANVLSTFADTAFNIARNIICCLQESLFCVKFPVMVAHETDAVFHDHRWFLETSLSCIRFRITNLHSDKSSSLQNSYILRCTDFPFLSLPVWCTSQVLDFLGAGSAQGPDSFQTCCMLHKLSLTDLVCLVCFTGHVCKSSCTFFFSHLVVPFLLAGLVSRAGHRREKTKEIKGEPIFVSQLFIAEIPRTTVERVKRSIVI